MSSCNNSRRRFLRRASAASAACIIPCFIACAKEKVSGKSGWETGKQINPAIENLRVVCCHDPSMVRTDPVKWDMAGQNAPVVRERVHKNLDEMAKSLAQVDSTSAAWSKIFKKAKQKQWREVKVAIKVNCISKNHPRYAVVEKICLVLHDLGIPYSNIIIYDALSDAIKHYQQAVEKELPAGIVVSSKADALGGMVETYVPQPISAKYNCVKDLAEGSIDILINIAVNKGCNKTVGGLTLSLKNHAGTFNPKPIHMGGGMDYLLAFNRSEAIVGGSPVRQQLCVIDSLWGAKKGPWGAADKRLSRLIMGTFSPALDYLTAKKIREPLLDAEHNGIERFLTSFGYTIPDNLDIINVAPAA